MHFFDHPSRIHWPYKAGFILFYKTDYKIKKSNKE